MKFLPCAVALLLAAAPAAHAIESETLMRDYLDAKIRPWAQDAVLVAAIAAQNAETAALSPAEIDARDQEWRAQVGASETPLIDGVLTNAAADFLRAQMELSGGMITEIFIMDQVGLNVAASGVTSDYWQGDEEKFTMTYPVGPEAVHVSEIEFDESSQTFQAQISIPLLDPASGKPIGAMTVGINAEGLM